MKLAANYAAVFYDRRYLRSVRHVSDGVGLIRGLKPEAVYEIKIGSVGNAVENRVVRRVVQLIPADVRNAFRAPELVQANHHARHEIQSRRAAAFFTVRRQHLHSKTNPQHGRPAPDQFSNRFVPGVFAQMPHSVGESPHARQHDFIHFVQGPRLLCDADFDAQILEGAAHGGEIAHAVVDDADFHSLS